MNRRTRAAAATGLLVLVLAACAAPAARKAPTPTPRAFGANLSLQSTCGTSRDSTSAILAAIDKSNATVVLPKDGCFNVSSLLLEGVNHLTLNGNGSTFHQPEPATPTPIMNLWDDHTLLIESLTIDGAGGPGPEGDYGIVMEADSSILFLADTISNTLGDWVYLSPPYDVPTGTLNTGITFTRDTFLNAGYHGFTVESVGCLTKTKCNGLNVNNSTMTNIEVDGIDFEVDTYSTDFSSEGIATDFAENYTTFKNDVWTNMNGSNWFTSDQGQVPGVQEQHVTLTGNTINDNAPLIEIVGTPTTAADPNTGKTVSTTYLNIWLTVTDNKMGSGYYVKPYRGGTSQAISIYSVVGLTMTHNSFPWCPGDDPPACDGTPAEYEMDLYNAVFDNISNNDFTGAIGVRQPQDYNQNDGPVRICGNTVGPTGTPAATPC